MSFKVLVPIYSQTGQLEEVVNSFLDGFTAGAEVDIDRVRIELTEPYPYPWNAVSFFDAMPESVRQIPQSVKEPVFKHEEYDLILLPYQPWFLSPSIPMNSFLHLPSVRKRLKNTPVVTLIGCRNMWVMAQEKMKSTLREIGAIHSGNIVLVDHAGNLTSVVTVLRWMLYGKKGNSGISGEDIAGASVFGKIVMQALVSGRFNELQTKLLEAGAVKIVPDLLLMESRGSKLFPIYASFIAAKGSRGDRRRIIRVRILLFLLPTVIFLASPFIWLISRLNILLNGKALRAQIEAYSGI